VGSNNRYCKKLHVLIQNKNEEGMHIRKYLFFLLTHGFLSSFYFVLIRVTFYFVIHSPDHAE
jgi:hypothetical protein